MEALKIDLNDYVHAGEGANGESFNHKTDPSIMMKLYNPGKVQQPLDEMLMARKVYALGIPSPEPGDYVTDGVRYGIRFRRVEGKTPIPAPSATIRKRWRSTLQNLPICAKSCTRCTWILLSLRM